MTSEPTIEELTESYMKALREAQALVPVDRRCHDCGVKPGRLHKRGCDSPICTICGVQLLQCGHAAGNSVHTGIEGQMIDIVCEVMDLYSRWGGDGWESCGRDDAGSGYDLNEGVALYQKALRRVREMALRPRDDDPFFKMLEDGFQDTSREQVLLDMDVGKECGTCVFDDKDGCWRSDATECKKDGYRHWKLREDLKNG